MQYLIKLKELLHYPIARLATGELTVGSLLTAVVVIVIGRLLAVAAGRGAGRLLAARGLPQGAQFAMAKIMRYLVTLLAVFVAASSIGIRLDAVLAASTVVLVGIGFGLQNIAQNFISGIILLIERPVAKGDFVQIGQAFGSVVDIGLRATRVVTRDEVTIIVPNSQLISEQVVNHSAPSHNLRISIAVGVAYDSDVEQVRQELLAVAASVPEVLRQPAPEVRFQGFGESSLDFALLVWVDDPREDMRVSSAVRFAMAAAFRRASIVIPFPQRDLHIRAGQPPH
jgi:small-conductance mechanosensitive channel